MARLILATGTFILLLTLGITYVKSQSITKIEVVEKQVIVEAEPVKHDYKQLACLAKNIYHEARGEPIRGQMAVAIVTMNRVNSSKFPNSICDVVYQRNPRGCQFSWVCQGTNDIRDMEKFTQAIEIARLVVEGKYNIDVLENALYYHADYVRPKWSKVKTKVTQIGRHIFYEYRV